MNSPEDTVTTAVEEQLGALQQGIAILRTCLSTGKIPATPELLENNDDYLFTLNYILELQKSLTRTSQGDFNAPVPLKGYTAGLVKCLQSNLRHVAWKARQIAYGDFSHQIDFMGEMGEAFNSMVDQLHKAHSSLEEQRQNLTDLSENLKREIDARIAVEADLRREERRLQRLASTDVLTGIANRRYFFQLARREVERTRRTGEPACVAMIDLDYFKTINDTYGHKQGDKALRRLAKLIVSTVRSYDIVGRYGGDEFIVFFPNTTTDGAYQTLERLRGIVNAANVTPNENGPTFSISVGLTTIRIKSEEDSPLDDAIVRADQALYQSKLKGRNCTSVV